MHQNHRLESDVIADYAFNRNRQPAELILAHANCWVAWSAEGTTLLASAKELGILEQELRSRGISPEEVVLEWIDDPAVGWL